MADLSQKQFRMSLAIGALLYSAAVAGTGMWLVSNGETTVQRRLQNTPGATFELFEKKAADAVPPSWQDPAAALPATEKLPEEISPPVAEAPVKETPAKEEPVEPKVAESASSVEINPLEEAAPVADVTALPEQKAVPAVALNWQKFARPFDVNDKRPRIALVIADLGLARNATDAAVQTLPGEVTLAFSSLTTDLEAWIAKARAAGHETVLTIPMEPVNYPQNDPGPNVLLLGQDDKENVLRLRRALSRADGYVGIMPSMGEKFVTSEDKMLPVMDAVFEQGLLVLDGTQARDSLIAPLSRLGRIPFARSDLKVDAAAAVQSIDGQLGQLETIAREHGSAVGIALPYPVTLERVKAWIATLEKKGIVLAPLTAAVSQGAPAMAAEADMPPEAAASTAQ